MSALAVPQYFAIFAMAQQQAAPPAAWLVLIPLLLVAVVVIYLLVRFRGYAAVLFALGVAGVLTLGGHGLARLGDALESNDALGGLMLAVATTLLLAAAGLIHWMYLRVPGK